MGEDERQFLRTVGELIQDARKRAGLRQDEVAATVGLSRVSVANIEAGVQRCSLWHLVQIGRRCGVDYADLIPPEWRLA